MRRHIIAAAIALASIAAHSSTASAQELTEPGNFAFSIERLFGFYVDNRSVDVGPADFDTSTTDFSLGWNSPPSALTVPRLGIDYFIDENFTLGGNFGIFSRSTNTDPGGDSDLTGIIFAVRGGYALRLGHAVSFWPRVGFTYTTVNADTPAGDEHLLSLGLEGMFTLAPSEGWAFLLGPTIDIGLSGEVANNDMHENCFGIMFGMLGYFGS